MKAFRPLSITIVLMILGFTAYYFYPEKPLPLNVAIDKIVVYKSERLLLAYSNGHIVKRYNISLGFTPVGKKTFMGDGKTPEGVYTINGKSIHSKFYKNLSISYPSARDSKEAAVYGKKAGSDIKIHGLPNGFPLIGKFHRWYDWTRGCIAVTNREMDELYSAVDIGTPIEINP